MSRKALKLLKVRVQLGTKQVLQQFDTLLYLPSCRGPFETQQKMIINVAFNLKCRLLRLFTAILTLNRIIWLDKKRVQTISNKYEYKKFQQLYCISAGPWYRWRWNSYLGNTCTCISKQELKVHFCRYPMSTWRRTDVITSHRRQYDVMYLLGILHFSLFSYYLKLVWACAGHISLNRIAFDLGQKGKMCRIQKIVTFEAQQILLDSKGIITCGFSQ